jgi:hypothetical protein
VLLLNQERSDGQAMTSLGTAGTNDGTTATGTHTDEETMGTLAAYDGGLIGTFHDGVPCEKSARLQPVSHILVKLFSNSSQKNTDKPCG